MNSQSGHQPFSWVSRFLRWFCHPELIEDIEGDLLELFDQRANDNALKAKFRHTMDVLLLCRPGIIRDLTYSNNNFNNIDMVKNYLKSAWRNLVKHRGFSAINIFSLSIGMSACLIIFLFVKDERSFDAMHQKNIYRLCEIQSYPGTNTQNVALSTPGMGPTIIEEFPEVQAYTRINPIGSQLVDTKGKKLKVDQGAAVDSTFFEIFDYPLVNGDRNTLLDGVNDAVLTESLAMNMYNDTNVIGESFILDGNTYVVRGVMEDFPENSHIQYDLLISLSTIIQNRPDFNSYFGSNFVNTYLVINENANIKDMATRFPDYLVKASGNENYSDFMQIFLQPLNEVHLASTDIEHDYQNYRKFNGEYLGAFLLVGLFILLIASVNFMNLTTARASNRAKEIGVRKTIGALKKQLFYQFILESVMLSIMALAIAITLTIISLPLLNNLIDRELDLANMLMDPMISAVILSTTVLIGVLAGVYPALYLSSFKPVIILKGFKTFEKKSIFRSSLVVLQFSLALGMIVSTLVVVQQLRYMKNKDIGFNKDHILLVELNSEASGKYRQIKEELQKRSNILGVTASGQRLGNNFHQWGFKAKVDTAIVGITPSNVHVDYNYLDVYDIKLKSGRKFSEDFTTDNGLAFIVNEAFAEELGFDEPLGQKVGHGWYPDDSLGTIIGVTENFNFNSLHFKVNTLSMVVHEDWNYSEMSVKVNGANIQTAIAEVEDVYNQFVVDYPIEYEFLDKHFEELYKSDQQMSSVITIVAILSIIIGCMGLFGLASISIKRRIKEVGIRKVMGASGQQLMYLLSRNFALMILISFLIATPFTYIFMSGWLESFAFRTQINPLLFVGGGIMSLVIALATVSYHVLKAINANPVKALKYE
ncbi:MAG: FtsX-like permease family protein [Bacteroidota bacterium]